MLFKMDTLKNLRTESNFNRVYPSILNYYFSVD